METLALFTGYLVVTVVGAIALTVAWRILRGTIDLKLLVSEANGAGSMSRFQFLIFTVVVAGCLLVLTLESGAFPKIPNEVLILVGLSGGGYVGAKTISERGGGQPKGAAKPTQE